MVRKSFKVTVNGETFNVEVEEVTKQKKEVTVPEIKKTAPKPVATAAPAKEAPDKKKETSGEAERKTEPDNNPNNNKEAVALSQGTVVSAPMPGSVLDVKVKEGDTVSKDDVLIILEAMKMENEITSPVSGKVSQVKVAKGSAVNSKDPLIIIE